MKPSFEELSAKIEEIEKEDKRVEMAVTLGICPECGAELTTKSEKSTTGFWIFKSVYIAFYRRCSVDETHYNKFIHDNGSKIFGEL